MRVLLLVTIAIAVWIYQAGSPFAVEQPQLDTYYGSSEPILPMTFAHVDHVSVGCIDCHHNYVDDTGDENCMTCHVRDQSVWPLLEEQFHALCQGCHEELAARMENGGPPRQCQGCHLPDELP